MTITFRVIYNTCTDLNDQVNKPSHCQIVHRLLCGSAYNTGSSERKIEWNKRIKTDNPHK